MKREPASSPDAVATSPFELRPPVDQVEAGRSFFSELDLNVSHFAAVWHSFKVGERLAADLNAVSARHDLSIADFHLLGALMMERPTPLRATDLALALHVTNAAISTRVARLAAQGLLERAHSATDHRAVLLHLTDTGAAKVRAIGAALEHKSRFIALFRRLPEVDRDALERIMGELHTQLARSFVPVSRSKV